MGKATHGPAARPLRLFLFSKGRDASESLPGSNQGAQLPKTVQSSTRPGSHHQTDPKPIADITHGTQRPSGATLASLSARGVTPAPSGHLLLPSAIRLWLHRLYLLQPSATTGYVFIVTALHSASHLSSYEHKTTSFEHELTLFSFTFSVFWASFNVKMGPFHTRKYIRVPYLHHSPRFPPKTIIKVITEVSGNGCSTLLGWWR
jgi:hypothetical protein